MDTEANHRFEQFVRQHRGRLTPQRQFIVREFLAMKGHHHNIEELHQHLRRKGKVINPSTIYRTLKLLVQAGIAVERQFANGNTQYDVNVAHHDHLICLSCKKILEFDSPRLEGIQAEIVHNFGFEMTFHRHEIYGYCSNCRRNRKRGKDVE
jgi:Fur family ferric uptake transcriptional regulator